MTNNVIIFPKAKGESPPQSLEELHESIATLRKARADYMMTMAFPHIIQIILEGGLDIDSEKCGKDLALFCESFKALVYKSLDLEHALHDFTESSFSLFEHEDGNLEYKYDLDIVVDKTGEE